MPYQNHLRLTASGTIGPVGGVIEQFSMRLNMSDPAVEAISQGTLDDMAADWVAFWGRTTSGISSLARLTQVKLARIGTDGKYRERDPLVKLVNQAGTGNAGSTAWRYPPQVSLALSLVTNKPGPRGQGRVFLPVPTQLIQPDGLISPADADAVRQSFATLINDLNNAAGLDTFAGEVVVASGLDGNARVQAVRVGRALDTIRSRRADLLEKYTAPLQLAP